MSSDFYALPELSSGDRGATLPTALSMRALRFARLLMLLVRLWLFARFSAARLTPAARACSVRSWARRILTALSVEVRTRGHVPTADAPLLIVANHVSWLDSYALNTVSTARFVAKSEVRGWPLIGTVAARFDTIFIKRGCYRAAARVVGTLATALSESRPAAAFPEATTSDGGRPLRFFPAMFQAAVSSGACVQPVAIRYRNSEGEPTNAAAFVGEMSVLDSLRRLLREPRLTAELVFCAPLDSAGRTRRELAALAHAAIEAALGTDGEALGSTPFRRAA
jgi:1-acyl-sn-glycerol-3-phosphate acyltransferase